MKKHILLIICLIYNLTFLFAQNSETTKDIKYPSYNLVVEKYFEKYAKPDLPEVLKFAKKQDGWHIIISDVYKESSIIKDELFWSRKKNKFLSVNFPHKTKETSHETLNQFINEWDIYSYSIEPYYGYTGWDWDVICDYGNKQNLSDTLLNALARAYSSYASNLLNNNTGLSDPSKRFNLPDGMNSLSPDQLEKYIKYRHLSIETYFKLYQHNPKFETFIGGISYDYSNAYMNSYFDLCMYQNEDEAKKEIIPGLYDSVSVSFAENYLVSCAYGAVLFTNGDNDTYPLLYVQNQFDFRKDVIIINLSLLNTSRYIDYIKSKANDLFSLTHDQYKNGTRDYVYFISDSTICQPDKYYDLKQLIAWAASDDPKTKFATSGGNVEYFPTKNLSIPVDKQFVLKNGTVAANYTDSIVTSIDWTLNSYGVLKSYLMVLDLIANNTWKRPIYFSITTSNDYHIGLEKYFQLEGLAYRLVPISDNDGDGQVGSVNTKVMYDNLMNKFSWGNMQDTSVFINECKQRMCMNFRNNFARLANGLINESKKDSAINVLDKCTEVMPEKTIPFNYFILPVAEAYYEAVATEKANKLIKRLTDIYEEKLVTLFAIKGKNTKDNKDEKEQTLAIMNKILTIANEYKQEAISKRAKDLFDKYYSIFSQYPQR